MHEISVTAMLPIKFQVVHVHQLSSTNSSAPCQVQTANYMNVRCVATAPPHSVDMCDTSSFLCDVHRRLMICSLAEVQQIQAHACMNHI